MDVICWMVTWLRGLVSPKGRFTADRPRRIRPIRHSTRTGSVMTIMLLFALPVLFGFAALAMDLGMVQYAREQLQIGVDAAALAGAAALMEAAPPPSWTDVDTQEEILTDRTFMTRQRQLAAAQNEAIQYAARNQVLYRPITLAAKSQNFRHGDVNIGWVEDPTDLACEMTSWTGVSAAAGYGWTWGNSRRCSRRPPWSIRSTARSS